MSKSASDVHLKTSSKTTTTTTRELIDLIDTLSQQSDPLTCINNEQLNQLFNHIHQK